MQLLLDAFPPNGPYLRPAGVVANPNVNYRIVDKYNYLNQRRGLGKWLSPTAWVSRILDVPNKLIRIGQHIWNDAALERAVKGGKVAVVQARRR